jgi:hypothetical protein
MLPAPQERSTAPDIHPELQADEVFLSNLDMADMHLLSGWQTARLGTQALDLLGEPIEDSSIVPVFVKKQEYEKVYSYPEADRE